MLWTWRRSISSPMKRLQSPGMIARYADGTPRLARARNGIGREYLRSVHCGNRSSGEMLSRNRSDATVSISCIFEGKFDFLENSFVSGCHGKNIQEYVPWHFGRRCVFLALLDSPQKVKKVEP